jgi:hypothetical protein
MICGAINWRRFEGIAKPRISFSRGFCIADLSFCKDPLLMKASNSRFNQLNAQAGNAYMIYPRNSISHRYEVRL